MAYNSQLQDADGGGRPTSIRAEGGRVLRLQEDKRHTRVTRDGTTLQGGQTAGIGRNIGNAHHGMPGGGGGTGVDYCNDAARLVLRRAQPQQFRWQPRTRALEVSHEHAEEFFTDGRPWGDLMGCLS